MVNGRSAYSSFNPNIERLPIYNAGMAVGRARAISGKQDIARLASNENPYGCSPLVREALAASAFEPWRYPDPQCTALRGALSERLGVSADQIVIGNGSEELIAAIARAVLVPGDATVTVLPSFGLHEIEPLAAGSTVFKVPLTPQLEFDIEVLHEAIASRPKLVFLSSPSNPVGCILGQADLETLVRAVRPGTFFVLDEAYFEYAAKELPDSIALLKEAAVPMIVLRTFSKAYGLAGLRVGYAITQDARMAQVIAAAKPPFNVNMAAQMGALAALQDEAWMQDAVARTIVERDKVASHLYDMGFQTSQSKANSVFFNTGMDSGLVADYLVEQGVIVKPWRESQYQQYIRVSAGTAGENNLFVDQLGALVSAYQEFPAKAQSLQA